MTGAGRVTAGKATLSGGLPVSLVANADRSVAAAGPWGGGLVGGAQSAPQNTHCVTPRWLVWWQAGQAGPAAGMMAVGAGPGSGRSPATIDRASTLEVTCGPWHRPVWWPSRCRPSG